MHSLFSPFWMSLSARGPATCMEHKGPLQLHRLGSRLVFVSPPYSYPLCRRPSRNLCEGSQVIGLLKRDEHTKRSKSSEVPMTPARPSLLHKKTASHCRTDIRRALWSMGPKGSKAASFSSKHLAGENPNLSDNRQAQPRSTTNPQRGIGSCFPPKFPWRATIFPNAQRHHPTLRFRS
jgi:hypothetical protein